MKRALIKIARVALVVLVVRTPGPALAQFSVLEGIPGLSGPAADPLADRALEQVDLNKAQGAGLMSLTVEEAIALALQNNPVLMVEKIRVEQARARIGVEAGSYDTLFTLSGRTSRRDNIVASRFFPEGRYVDMEYAPGLRLERRMDHGGNLSLGIDYSRISSTSNTQTLSPQYSANLAVGLAQPLLRDFGSDVGTTRLRVAEKGAEIAEQTLYQRVAELIRQVEETYVSYAFLLSDIEGKRRSLDIARGFEEQSQELFQAGRVAQVSVLQARSAVAEREELVLAAEAEAARFEDRLKNLLWLDLATTELEPRPLPERVALGLDPAASFQLALARRPEILALRREVEQREIEVRFADNQLRPRLDLAAEYSLAGLAGKPNPTCLDPTSVFCTPVGDSVAGSIFAGQTGATDAVSTLFRSSPFDTWSVGLTFELPVGNRTANGLRSEATLRLLEARTELATLEDQVQEEIRNAIRETQTADARIGTSGQTVTYLEDQLEGMESQLEAGFVSAYEVLEVLDALDQARTRQLRAVMDFNIGLSRVRFAEAASLERYGVEVVALPRYEFAPPILR